MEEVEVEDAEADEGVAQEDEEPADQGEEEAVEEEAQEPVEDQLEEDDSLPRREDDLKLSEVPEDMREAVEGNITLKRMLSGGPASEQDQKRRKQGADLVELDAEREEVIRKWLISRDAAVRYVLQAAEIETIRALAKTGWKPNPRAINTKNKEPKSSCEQVNERLLQILEDQMCSKYEVNVLEAWQRQWKIKAEDIKRMKEANHKDMRYVMKEFDGTRDVADLLAEAAMTMPSEDCEKTEDVLPDKPGLSTVSRFNRLELIDPQADALVVGDANLTFSALLAEHREGLGHVGRVVATTFETIEILRERYVEIDQTVKGLEDKMSEVLHNVDGTRLAVDPRFKGMEKKFGAVYYNFPHAGVVQGFFDGHPFVRWRHENLMHLFFRALRGFVKPGGIVKVSSNGSATGVRYSDIICGAQNSEFVHIETFPFLEWQLRNYGRSYGDRRDKGRRPDDGENYRAQRAQSDMVYCFRYEPSGGAPPKAAIRQPPTKEVMMDSNECRLRLLSEHAKQKRVEELFELFLTYVQGIHVG